MYLFNFHILGRDKLIEAILKAVPGWDNVGRLMSNISSVSSWLRLLRLRWFKSLQWWRRKHFLFAGREHILATRAEAAHGRGRGQLLCGGGRQLYWFVFLAKVNKFPVPLEVSDGRHDLSLEIVLADFLLLIFNQF